MAFDYNILFCNCYLAAVSSLLGWNKIVYTHYTEYTVSSWATGLHCHTQKSRLAYSRNEQEIQNPLTRISGKLKLLVNYTFLQPYPPLIRPVNMECVIKMACTVIIAICSKRKKKPRNTVFKALYIKHYFCLMICRSYVIE